MNPNAYWLHKHIDFSNIFLKIDLTSDLKSSPDIDYTVLRDFKNVASYNWSSDNSRRRPHIVIPGKPCLLNEKLQLQKLSLKKYARIADENLTNLPDYRIEPIYR